MVVLLILGLLIFGRRLPEVGRSLGKTVVQLRRGLQDFKDQIAADEDLREVRATVHDLRRAVDAPRVMADPRRLMEGLTDDTLVSPGPDTTEVEPRGPDDRDRATC